jgi:RNA polymerase sigma-70 factor (ECF subfamily)
MTISAGAQFATLHWPSSNSADISDEPLVKAAQVGDRAAFGQLYQRYVRMVHGILLARVPTIAAEDLVQDVFLHALPSLRSLRDTSRFGPWLAAIARNRATDFHRRAKPETSLDQNPATVEKREESRSESGIEEGKSLLNAVRELPDAYREPLILRFVEGMSGPEIASRTGLTHGSVRVNLHRGMQMLRQKWDETRVGTPMNSMNRRGTTKFRSGNEKVL